MISTEIHQVLCLPKGANGMPVIVCPHCKIGSDLLLVSSQPKKKFSNVVCHIAFCRLCDGRVWLETDNDGKVISSEPPFVEEVPTELPDDVKRAFREALVCYQAQAPNGSALMCRRAVQEALDTLGAPNGDLPKQLDALVAAYKITPDLRQWADHARIGGRIGGHGTGGQDWGAPSKEWVTMEDARAVIEFCRSFFEYVFIMPERNRLRRQQTGTLFPPEGQSGTGSNAP